MEHLALAIQEEREREGVTWRQGRWCVNSKRVLARALVEVRGLCDKGRIEQSFRSRRRDVALLKQVEAWIESEDLCHDEALEELLRSRAHSALIELPDAGYLSLDSGEKQLKWPTSFSEQLRVYISLRAQNRVDEWSRLPARA